MLACVFYDQRFDARAGFRDNVKPFLGDETGSFDVSETFSHSKSKAFCLNDEIEIGPPPDMRSFFADARCRPNHPRQQLCLRAKSSVSLESASGSWSNQSTPPRNRARLLRGVSSPSGRAVLPRPASSSVFTKMKPLSDGRYFSAFVDSVITGRPSAM